MIEAPALAPLRDRRAPPGRGRGAGWLLVLVGCAYGVAQLLLFDPARFVEFDEAIYLSQVQRGVLAVPFAEHRARGITLLVAPLALAGAPLVAVRLYLVVVSAVLLTASFWPWLRLLGHAAPLAATFFAGTWLTLYYGSEIMPNLHAAFALVAATGLAAVAMSQALTRRELLLLGVVIAWATLIRPTDAILASAGLLALSLAPRPEIRRLRLWGAVLAGLVVGWLPWVIEAAVRFGGPVQRWRIAAERVGEARGAMLVEHLRVIDGPLVGVAPDEPVSLAGIIWWTVMLGLAVLGVLFARKAARTSLVMAAAAAAPVLAAYLLAGQLAPRFLLPVYALLSLPGAFGALSIGRRLMSRRLRIGMVAVLCGALLGWHVPTALRIAADRAPERAIRQDIGMALKDRVDGRRCRFAAEFARAQIQFASGCLGSDYDPSGTEEPFPSEIAGDDGGDEYVLVESSVNPDSPVSARPAERLPHGWVLFHWSVAAQPMDS